MENDFSWIIRILASSKNLQHIKVSEKLFENFKKKWSEFIEDSVNDIVYTRQFNEKKRNIQKKLGFS
jgi:hypothetical protein